MSNPEIHRHRCISCGWCCLYWNLLHLHVSCQDRQFESTNTQLWGKKKLCWFYCGSWFNLEVCWYWSYFLLKPVRDKPYNSRLFVACIWDFHLHGYGKIDNSSPLKDTIMGKWARFLEENWSNLETCYQWRDWPWASVLKPWKSIFTLKLRYYPGRCYLLGIRYWLKVIWLFQLHQLLFLCALHYRRKNSTWMRVKGLGFRVALSDLYCTIWQPVVHSILGRWEKVMSKDIR